MGLAEKIKYAPLVPVASITAYSTFNAMKTPYDKLVIGFNEIGYVSASVVGLLFISYYLRLDTHKTLMRFLITVMICATGLICYEVFWNFGWFLNEPIIMLDVLGFITCEIVLLYTFGFMRKKFKMKMPTITWLRYGIVCGIMFASIMWLRTTPFYEGWSQHYFDSVDINPHNFEWALGKSVSLLSWMGVVECRHC